MPSMSESWFARRFEALKWLGYLAFAGVALGVGAFLVGSEGTRTVLTVLAVLSILPVFVYGMILPIWHWKERYVGDHSDLWGVLLVLEVSSWFKLVYWFRHILADWHGNGRYSKRGSTAPAQSTDERPAV